MKSAKARIVPVKLDDCFVKAVSDKPTRSEMPRRTFLKMTAVGAGAVCLGLPAEAGDGPAKLPEPMPGRLPRWRGFNLLEKFTYDNNQPFLESDFAQVAELGFDFVRLPMSYRCWTPANDWRDLKEPVLKEIDAAVDRGRRYGVHVNLNFHRAPGFCVNPPAEPFDLWKDPEALTACAYHWTHFAKRYRGISNANLSFNLLNEPNNLPDATYIRVVKRLVEAVRAEDETRLIIADGLNWGNKPVPGLADLKIGQSVHRYNPVQLTHYKASWMHGSDQWPEPTWPLKLSDGEIWDKEHLHREIEPWQALARQGVGVHVGEWGAFNRTPHDVMQAWMRDQLSVFKEAGFGWALWNFRGSFGVLDSDRADVQYENWHGRRLDRKMLELLQTT
jgi:endoglucanase